MIIQFALRNYRSFKDEIRFSFVASKDKEHLSTHVFEADEKLNLLKTAAIYGANASGKSNVFMALQFMKQFIINSARETSANAKIAVENFRLDIASEKKPSLFDLDFIYKGIQFRYGFEVDQTRVHSEWLYYAPKGRTVELFTRKGKKIHLGRKFQEGLGLDLRTRENALFLSVVAQFNGEISLQVLEYFSKRFKVISNIDEDGYRDFTLSKLKDKNLREKMIKFIRIADLGISSFRTESQKIPPQAIPTFLPEEIKQKLLAGEGIAIRTMHKKYDKNKPVSEAEFDLAANESAGTQRIFFLSGPLIDTLENGNTLFVDELDSRLHPLMTQFIIGLFNSQETNPKNAQLIFASQNTHLFNSRFFRRDQLWITEKDRHGASALYSLNDYGSVRKDASFEKDYLLGKYGGVPLIKDEYSLFTE